ncbi:MAG TPA: hypothetical protein VLV16_09135 [Gemmatimonadales bacterium]|nr:hypothetical protein [Gemmatimonadales bacterium]
MLGPLIALTAILHAQIPDSAARTQRLAALKAFDDSLTAVSAATTAFRADLNHASPDLVLSRAARVQRHCASAAAQGQRLAADSLDSQLRHELTSLRTALNVCAADFTTGVGYRKVDSLAAWAPYRLARLDDAIRRYRGAARTFQHRVGQPS